MHVPNVNIAKVWQTQAGKREEEKDEELQVAQVGRAQETAGKVYFLKMVPSTKIYN